MWRQDPRARTVGGRQIGRAGPGVPGLRTVLPGALALATAGAGAGLTAGVLGVGNYYAKVLLDPTRREFYPERLLDVRPDPRGPRDPADGNALLLTLRASRLVRQPGVWGLRWPEGLAVMGEIVAQERGTVVRRLMGGPVPPPGPVVVDAGPFDPDPGALGLPFSEIAVPTQLGPAPAWFVPAADAAGVVPAAGQAVHVPVAGAAGPVRVAGGAVPVRATGGAGQVWAIAVHGRGGRRREALRILRVLHRLGLPTLVISYRNDEEAPPSPDGHFHLGDTEWEDLAAAVRHALAHGARRLVLVCWSMGAAVSGAFLDRAAEAGLVDALVWDAPLVDWRACLRRQARNRRLPPGLVPVATAFVTRRIGIDFDRFDLRRTPPRHRPPTLIVHSVEDTAVPITSSRALVAAAPGLGWPMRLLEVPDVEHTASWNADPARYERAVADFLGEILAR